MAVSIPDDTVTHKDLARLLGVSETTIKNYRSRFPEFFEVRGAGKPLRFAAAVSGVCRDIRDCVREGLTVEQTRVRLRERHPMARSRRRDSGPPSPPPPFPPELVRLIPSLAGGLERLAALQDETNQRLERLEKLLAGYAAFPEGDAVLPEIRATLAALAARLEERGAARSGLAGSPRLVRVRNAYGEVQEYRFESAPAPGEDAVARGVPGSEGPGFAPAGAERGQARVPEVSSGPGEAFLHLPLVVRSGQGEYLGVGGRGAGPFSTADLMELTARRFQPPNAFSFRWEVGGSGGAGWLLRAAQGQEAEAYSLELEPARTPRGNDVALVLRLEVDGKEVSPVFLHNFIRQMREMEPGREEGP